MRRRLIIGCCSIRSGDEWQRKMDYFPGGQPKLQICGRAVSEVLKACNVSQAQLPRKTFLSFFFQCFQ